MIIKNQLTTKIFFQIKNFNENCLVKWTQTLMGGNVAWQTIDELSIQSHASQEVKALTLAGNFVLSQTNLSQRYYLQQNMPVDFSYFFIFPSLLWYSAFLWHITLTCWCLLIHTYISNSNIISLVMTACFFKYWQHCQKSKHGWGPLLTYHSPMRFYHVSLYIRSSTTIWWYMINGSSSFTRMAFHYLCHFSVEKW